MTSTLAVALHLLPTGASGASITAVAPLLAAPPPSACGPTGTISDAACTLVGGVGSVIHGVGSAAGEITEILQNPFRWLYHHTLGAPIPQQPSDRGWSACQQDWSQASCPKLIDGLKPDSIDLGASWPQLYGTFAVSGMVTAAFCCTVRLLRGLFDERVAGMHLVVDSVVRLTVASALLLAPSPDHSLLLGFLRLATSASGSIAIAAGGATASAFTAHADLAKAVSNIATAALVLGVVGNFLVIIPVLLAGLALLYIIALYLVRVVQLLFAVATAPLFVALAVYDLRNRFFSWWLDLFTSAMVIPVVLAVFGALTAGLALFFLGGNANPVSDGGAVEGVTRTLLACMVVMGGVWMTGKAVHGLAWRSFSHSGITGALTAISTTAMALPALARDAGGVMHALGRAPKPGGFLETLSRPSRADGWGGGGGSPGGLGTGRIVAAAAAGHTARAGANPAAAAAARAAATARFSDHRSVADLLEDDRQRKDFDGAVGVAIGEMALTPQGASAVAAATAHLPAGADLTERTAEYTRLLAADPIWGNAVAGATLAALLHDRLPELAPLLAAPAEAPR